MTYYDSKASVDVEVICQNCKEKQEVSIQLGINLTSPEVSEVEVISAN